MEHEEEELFSLAGTARFIGLRAPPPSGALKRRRELEATLVV